jgi:hypothetical protein
MSSRKKSKSHHYKKRKTRGRKGGSDGEPQLNNAITKWNNPPGKDVHRSNCVRILELINRIQSDVYNKCDVTSGFRSTRKRATNLKGLKILKQPWTKAKEEEENQEIKKDKDVDKDEKREAARARRQAQQNYGNKIRRNTTPMLMRGKLKQKKKQLQQEQ